MVYWTTKSGERYLLNIAQPLIESMKKAGARFCWFRDTPGINDVNNETFYQEKEEDGEKNRDLRQGITVTAENGQQVTGYVTHWVENEWGKTTGTDIRGWFIFQPGTYPTKYIIRCNPEEDVVVTDL
jgi:hypothetical protein